MLRRRKEAERVMALDRQCTVEDDTQTVDLSGGKTVQLSMIRGMVSVLL